MCVYTVQATSEIRARSARRWRPPRFPDVSFTANASLPALYAHGPHTTSQELSHAQSGPARGIKSCGTGSNRRQGSGFRSPRRPAQIDDRSRCGYRGRARKRKKKKRNLEQAVGQARTEGPPESPHRRCCCTAEFGCGRVPRLRSKGNRGWLRACDWGGCIEYRKRACARALT